MGMILFIYRCILSILEYILSFILCIYMKLAVRHVVGTIQCNTGYKIEINNNEKEAFNWYLKSAENENVNETKMFNLNITVSYDKLDNIEYIAKGCFGKVYRAKRHISETINDNVALKELNNFKGNSYKLI